MIEIVEFAEMAEMAENAAIENLNINEEQTFEGKIEALMFKNTNYALWKNYLTLYSLICRNKGIIFGGATRDYVKHSIAAKKFGVFCKENKINFKDSYMKHYIQPETFSDRTLLPNDIDVYIYEEDFQNIKDTMQYNYMHYEKKGTSPCYLFTNNEALKQAINHYVYEIDILGKHGRSFINTIFGIENTKSFRIKIDYIVLKESFKHYRGQHCGYFFPPFGNPDFDVNQLYMQYTPECGLSVKVSRSLIDCIIINDIFSPFDNDEIIEKLKAKIYKNIENDIAVPILPNIDDFNSVLPESKPHINLGRLKKMLYKGYDVSIIDTLTYNRLYTKAPEDYEHNEEDKCIICLDTFTTVNPWYQIGCKCNVKMHLLCMSKYVRTPNMTVELEDNTMKCPHCRTKFRNCHCEIINFINSLKHKADVLSEKIHCSKCNFLSDVDCTAWYKQCPYCK